MSNLYRRNISFLLFNALFLIYTNNIFCGFLAGTPVKTSVGYQPVETIKPGLNLTSYSSVAGFFENKVTFVWTNATDACVVIRYFQTELLASAKQQFYLPESASWVAASQLKPGDKLLSEKHGNITVDAVEPVIFTGFTHCVQFEKVCNFCVSDDDIVTHNFAIEIDLLSFPSPEAIACMLCVAVFAFIAERIIASLGYNVDFCINQNGSIGGHKPFARHNNTVDFDNPYEYYGYKNPEQCYNNSSYCNNDVYSRHNDLVAQQTYHKNTIENESSRPAVGLTHLSSIKKNHQPSSTETPAIGDTHAPTKIPDPEIRNKPIGCPIPDVKIPIHTGGCGEVIRPEKIIHPTPVPEIEKKPQGCFPPIIGDISQIVLSKDRSVKKPKKIQIASGQKSPIQEEVFDPAKHPNGKYVASPKHHINSPGNIGKAPKNGQKALDHSVRTRDGSKERIAAVDGEFVVLKETLKGEYHGYVVDKLTGNQKKALQEAGKITSTGKIPKHV